MAESLIFGLLLRLHPLPARSRGPIFAFHVMGGISYPGLVLHSSKAYQVNAAGKAVHTMTQQFRYVAGHIEVYSEYGEFLFSADTMQEAWEELSA